MIPFNGVFLRILDMIKTSCQPKTLQINTNHQSYSVLTNYDLGHLPFNKYSGLKFRKFYVPNERVHSGFTDPTKATTHLVVVQSCCNQNTEEQKWRQQICKMERDISVQQAGPVIRDHLNILTRPN